MDSGEGRERTTYLLVDGENIDATLGSSILGRRPATRGAPPLGPAAPVRPRPVVAGAGRAVLPGREHRAADVVRAGAALDGLPAGPAGRRGPEKVVDIAIQRTMAAIAERDDDVLLVSNDGDFWRASRTCSTATGGSASSGSRSSATTSSPPLIGRGLEVIDLEYDVQAFTARLPRVRIIPIDEFDPLDFL